MSIFRSIPQTFPLQVALLGIEYKVEVNSKLSLKIVNPNIFNECGDIF